MFSFKLTISDLNFSKAMIWSYDHFNNEFLYNSVLGGLAKDARFSKNFLNMLVDLKNERTPSSFEGLG